MYDFKTVELVFTFNHFKCAINNKKIYGLIWYYESLRIMEQQSIMLFYII